MRQDRLREALIDILDMAEEREDVVDGNDGEPRPNAWMQVATMAREALGWGEYTPEGRRKNG